ncbi:hypothetical protein LDENG_00008520 [Lucifuga dentata]|nr:hypothetical protein LDENG_00008520 [Lucifuga dentata]
MMTLATSLGAFLLLLSIVPTITEVVTSILMCNHFLLGGNPPDIPGILINGQILNQNRYKVICQTYNNNRRFVTLYDITYKIPVFSAYKYTGDLSKDRPATPWKIEPQLENMAAGEDMQNDNAKFPHNYQAADADYNGQNLWDRGHLFPVSHAYNTDDKISTCTLTNTVPQAKTCNRGKWRVDEKRMKNAMDINCINNNKNIEGFVPEHSPAPTTYSTTGSIFLFKSGRHSAATTATRSSGCQARS